MYINLQFSPLFVANTTVSLLCNQLIELYFEKYWTSFSATNITLFRKTLTLKLQVIFIHVIVVHELY